MCAAAVLVPALWLGIATAADNKGQKPDQVCDGDFGTAVKFVTTPSEAAKQALKEEKLVLVLHVSGEFEDPDFT